MNWPAEISGIAFDLDGVLIDSSAVHAWAFQQALSQVGVENFEYHRWAGRRTRDVIDAVLAQNGRRIAEGRRAELAALKSRLALERLTAEPPIVPGCYELLHGLRKRFRLALTSSASAPSVGLFLERSRCRECFLVVLTGDDVERPKPSPEVYERAASLMGLRPTQTLVVEDAIAGVEAARGAGCRVWAVLGTAREADLLDAGAERLLTSVRELAD